MKSCLGCGVVVFLYAAMSLQAFALSRQDIDMQLKKIGADNAFDTDKTINWSVLPGPFYTPELKIGLGTAIVGLYRVNKGDSSSQNSSISFTGFVSSSGAYGLGMTNYTFFTDDQWRLFINGGIANIPTGYWGVDYSAAQGNEEEYTQKSVNVAPQLMYQLFQNLYTGIGWDFSSLQANTQQCCTTALAQQTGGVSPVSSGINFNLNIDTRDYITQPHRGYFFSVDYTVFDPDFGSDTHFTALKTQYNHYYPFNDQALLALDLYARFTQGEVPWDRLSLLGNDRRMRGYYEGRYRDNDMASAQVEYRQKLTWRHGYVLWLGVGALGNDVQDMRHTPLLPTVGVGYRFEVKPKMNIRLDLGMGKESTGFYFQVAEAF